VLYLGINPQSFPFSSAEKQHAHNNDNEMVVAQIRRQHQPETPAIQPYIVLLNAPPMEPHGQALGTSDNAPLWGDISAKSSFIYSRPRPWPSAAGVSFPKRISLAGILETHGIHHEIHFNLSWLGNNQTLSDRRNYHITI
jgi:hypothetical protein